MGENEKKASFGESSEDPHVGGRHLFLSSPPSDPPWPRVTKLTAVRRIGCVCADGFWESGMVEGHDRIVIGAGSGGM